MKLVWLSLLFGLTLAARAQNLPVQGSCTMGGVQVQTQGVLSTTRVTASYPRCNITVYNSGTVVPATIYSNGFGARLSNPFQARTDASWVFYIPAGTYVDVMMNGGTPVTMPQSVTVTYLQGGMWGGGLFGSNPGGGNGLPTGCTVDAGGLIVCPGFASTATQPLPVAPHATYFDDTRMLSVGNVETPTVPGRVTLAGDNTNNDNYVNYLDCNGPSSLGSCLIGVPITLSGSFMLADYDPYINTIATGAPLNQKLSGLGVDPGSGSLWYSLYNDDASGSIPWLIVDRSGPTPTGIRFGAPIYSPQKDFLIPDPLDKTKDLVHSSLEGPEVAVFYRGEAVTSNGEAAITLPEYFEALTRKENRTVQLTALIDRNSSKFAQLASTAVVDGKFYVRSTTPSQKFYWEVKAVRADVAPLEVIRTHVTSPGPPSPRKPPTLPKKP